MLAQTSHAPRGSPRMELDADSECSPPASEQVNQVTHYQRVIAGFDNYRRHALSANNRRRKDLYRLPLHDQALLHGYARKLEEVDDRIRRNADVLDEIVECGRTSGLNPGASDGLDDQASEVDELLAQSSTRHSAALQCSDKVRGTLRQLVRDWSALGAAERKACYDPILCRLDTFGAAPLCSALRRDEIRVLVPGSGLGRLVWEVANRGYTAQGNETSLQMLLTSNLVLNHAQKCGQWTIYPFIHSFSNFCTAADMLKEINFPDVPTWEVLNSADFGMSVGEFTQVFGEPTEKENWHAVLTCFFLDTAQNIVKYIRILHWLLKPGGMWINLGPTLWHYEGSGVPSHSSIELDVQELKQLCQKLGFEFESGNEEMVQTTYAGCPGNNLQHVYNAHYWVAHKKS